MTDLGNKFECFSCGVKFYDLGKSAAVCPSCGSDQKDADTEAEKSGKKTTRKKKTTKKKTATKKTATKATKKK